MHIENVAIYVHTLEVEKALFVKYFGAKASERHTNFQGDFKSYFPTLGNGSRLDIMHRQSIIDPKNAKQGHIAIQVGDNKAVEEPTRIIADDGLYIVAAERITGYGYHASIVADPEDNEIAILAGNYKGRVRSAY